MRNRRTGGPVQQAQPKKNEHVEVLDANTEIEDVRPADITAGDGQVKGSAVSAEPEDAPKAHWFRVVKEKKNVASNGQRVHLREGKEINDLAYDVNDLRRQGVELQQIEV